MSARRFTAALILLLLPACFDFGYDVERVEPGAGPGAGGGAGGDCTEGPADPSADGPQLAFTSLNVDQPSITIQAGDVLTFTNNDSMPHNVVAGAPGAEVPAAQGGFAGPNVTPGGTWAYRFCDPRTLSWFCAIHPAQMNGYTIVIQ